MKSPAPLFRRFASALSAYASHHAETIGSLLFLAMLAGLVWLA